jgi:hypothetical protein
MNRRILIILVIVFASLFLAGIVYAQDDDSSIGIDVGEDDFFTEETATEVEEYTEEEAQTMSPIKVNETLFGVVERVEQFIDEDGNAVYYYYNSEDQIIEKVIFICPPKEILDVILAERLLRQKEAFPGGNYTFELPGGGAIWEPEIYEELEIEEIDDFDLNDEPYIDIEEEDYGVTEEDISVAIFDEESEDPVITTEVDIEEEISIEEMEQEETYMIDDNNIIPGSGKYVDTMLEKYTIFTPEQSYIESLLVREAYEPGRIAIVVAQDIAINWDEGTYVCDFKSSFDAFHYLDGILVTKFEVRKGSYKTVRYSMETGNPVSERIHHSRAGSSYDLYLYYVNDEVQRQEIYYNGEIAYSTTPDDNIERFENVVLKYDLYGNLVAMEEIILNDYEETMNRGILTVDFSIYEIKPTDRAPYAELGLRKTYFDNWEMVKQVEYYMFGGEMALVRYYGLNGLLFREERYADKKLYSTVIFTFDELGYLSRINYIDVFQNVYKYKEGESFYNKYGEEVTEEEFIAIQPDYAVDLSYDDGFYQQLLEQIYGTLEEVIEEATEDDMEEEDFIEDEELEEGFEEDEGNG